MLELIESVKKHGVLVPAIARPKPDGGYELVAGHRRQRASQLAGLDSMPVIVMNLDDNDTIIQLVDSNIQRENILPSERAKAYKLRMEAVKKKAGRPQKEEDRNSPKISANFRSDDSIGELAGVSGDTRGAAPCCGKAAISERGKNSCAEIKPSAERTRPQGCISAPFVPKGLFAFPALGAFFQISPRFLARQGKPEKGGGFLVGHGLGFWHNALKDRTPDDQPMATRPAFLLG